MMPFIWAFLTGFAVLGVMTVGVAYLVARTFGFVLREVDAEDLWTWCLCTFFGVLSLIAIVGLCVSIGAAVLYGGGGQ